MKPIPFGRIGANSRSPLPIFLVLVLSCVLSISRDSEGLRTNSVLLNGTWEFARGEGNEGAETTAA